VFSIFGLRKIYNEEGGRSAVGIKGSGIYSYGNNTPLGSSILRYIESQSLVRNQLLTVIPADSQQTRRALEFFGGYPGKNSVGILDNCSVRSSEALKEGGVPIPGSPFPGSLARQAAGLPGTFTYFIPKNGSISPALAIYLQDFGSEGD
jgi:hypothetical protein